MIDSTYPKTIKLPLYQLDEYQVSDLLYFDAGMIVFSIVKRFKANYLFVQDYDASRTPAFGLNSNLVFADASDNFTINPPYLCVETNLTAEPIGSETLQVVPGRVNSYLVYPPTPNTGFRDITPNVAILPSTAPLANLENYTVPIDNRFRLIHRFSTWNYPWCEGYTQKLFNYYKNNRIKFFYQSLAFASNPSNGNPNDVWYQYLKPQTPILKNKPDYYLIDFLYQFTKGFIEFESSIKATVIITYLYRDKDWYSKGYRKLEIKEGSNKIFFDFIKKNESTAYLEILPCSMVVSSFPFSRSLENLIFNKLINSDFVKNDTFARTHPSKNLNKYLNYSTFDDFGNFVSNYLFDQVTLESRQTQDSLFPYVRMDEFDHDCSQFSSIYFANNNYWNNGVIYEDVNPQPLPVGIYGDSLFKRSFEDIKAEYDAQYFDNRIDKDMPDSVRIQEIHAALEAQKYARADNDKPERIANLGYLIERIAQVLGINVNSDGTIKSIRPRKRLKDGSAIPAGWNFGQWGYNERGNKEGQEGGNKGEFANGIVYQQVSNKLIPDKYNSDKSEIQGGDLELCENIPQLLQAIIDDLDKALGWQELGAGAIPNADGSNKFLTFEGSASLLTELMFMLSRVSSHTSQTLISSNITQATAKETLQGLGLPLESAYAEFNTGEDETSLIPYPALSSDSPTLTQQLGWIVMNIAHLMASNTSYLDTNQKDTDK